MKTRIPSHPMSMTLAFAKTLIPAVLLLLMGCVTQIPPPESELLDPDGRFILYVSNQCFAISPVDIQIEIDGDVVVRESFRVGDQHNWKEFTLNLSAGSHRLKVSSIKGDAELSREFDVKGDHWAVIDYLYYPKERGFNSVPRQLRFNIYDTPIGFM